MIGVVEGKEPQATRPLTDFSRQRIPIGSGEIFVLFMETYPF